jgi:hypothetical protein
VYHGLQLDWLRWIDRDGEVLPHGGELAATAQEHEFAAMELAASEAKRADEAEARLAELQARLAELERAKDEG